MSIHHGISCDFCRKKNFSHHRYKCLICNDFDLCGNCYESRSIRIISTHSKDHPMQLILTENDYEQIYFGSKRTDYSPGSFVCPFCNKNGFSEQCLTEHCEEKHSRNLSSVFCPICLTRSNHLLEHLYRHTDENYPTKTMKILATVEKSSQQNLLEKFLSYPSKRFEHHERSSFLHALLTDLIQRDMSTYSSI